MTLFDRIAPQLIGLFPFLTMFLVTSIATLRERRSGTLERLLTTPLGKADFLVGYAVTFGLLATAALNGVVGTSPGGVRRRGPSAAGVDLEQIGHCRWPAILCRVHLTSFRGQQSS